MKRFKKAVLTILPVFILLLILPALSMAQGSSPVKVTKIMVNPNSFKAGNTISFSIEIQNTSTSSYGCSGAKVSIHIYKATPYTVSNRVWHTEQPFSATMAPGEKKTVSFSGKWRVPNFCPNQFIVLAKGTICAPDEFDQSKADTFSKTCVYKRRQLLIRRPIHRRPVKKKL